MVAIRQVRLNDWQVVVLLTESYVELDFVPEGIDASDFEPPKGAFLVAERSGTPIGCGGVRRLEPGVAELKRLFVQRRERRRGVGRTLLGALERRAADLGLHEVRLDVRGDQSAALALFRSAGYEPIPDYNRNPNARHWFAKRLPAAEV